MTAQNTNSTDEIDKPFNQFEEAFYNWMLSNGMDIFVRGSKLSHSDMDKKWLCEIDPTKLKPAIQALLTEARIDQIMQDFTEFMILDGADESEWIDLRNEKIAQLNPTKTPEEK